MKPFFFWSSAFACLPIVAAAQPAATPATDPSAPVPAVAYRSVFADTPRGVETESIDWTAANTLVGQFTRGHIDILKWEAAQARAKEAAAAATPKADSTGMEHKKP